MSSLEQVIFEGAIDDALKFVEEETREEREALKREKEEVNREKEEVNREKEEVNRKREEMYQAREVGIRAIILDNLEEQVPKERIVLKLQKHFNLPKEKAEHYYKKYACSIERD